VGGREVRFIHLRLRTGHDVEKKKFLREASLDDEYGGQGGLRTHTQGNQRTELDENIAFHLELLSVRIFRVGQGAISFPVSVKLRPFTQ